MSRIAKVLHACTIPAIAPISRYSLAIKYDWRVWGRPALLSPLHSDTPRQILAQTETFNMNVLNCLKETFIDWLVQLDQLRIDMANLRVSSLQNMRWLAIGPVYIDYLLRRFFGPLLESISSIQSMVHFATNSMHSAVLREEAGEESYRFDVIERWKGLSNVIMLIEIRIRLILLEGSRNEETASRISRDHYMEHAPRLAKALGRAVVIVREERKRIREDGSGDLRDLDDT